VQYGNFIGETLRMAHDLDIPNVTLGVMLGKAVKLAQGQLDTHSKKATMDKTFVSFLLREAGCSESVVKAFQAEDVALARELWNIIPADRLPHFVSVVVGHCYGHCRHLLPNGNLTVVLIDDDGNIQEL
jgi:cobalt-precorrin-5B (C1)-methyltransferase